MAPPSSYKVHPGENFDLRPASRNEIAGLRRWSYARSVQNANKVAAPSLSVSRELIQRRLELRDREGLVLLFTFAGLRVIDAHLEDFAEANKANAEHGGYVRTAQGQLICKIWGDSKWRILLRTYVSTTAVRLVLAPILLTLMIYGNWYAFHPEFIAFVMLIIANVLVVYVFKRRTEAISSYLKKMPRSSRQGCLRFDEDAKGWREAQQYLNEEGSLPVVVTWATKDGIESSESQLRTCLHPEVQAYAGGGSATRIVILDDTSRCCGTILTCNTSNGLFEVQIDNSSTKSINLSPANCFLVKPFSYAVGTDLMVWYQNKFVDTYVERTNESCGKQQRKYELKLANSEGVICVDLNNENHSSLSSGLFESVSDVEFARREYCNKIIEDHNYVEDGITGNKLRIEDQIIYITTEGVVQEDGREHSRIVGLELDRWKDCRDMHALAALLLKPSDERGKGSCNPQPVLLRATAGTGKTWSMQQLYFLLARLACAGTAGEMFVPLIVYVQKLAGIIRRRETTSVERRGFDLLIQYVEEQFAGDQRSVALLKLAIEMRTVILLIDGVDEAAALATQIESLVHHELVPRGLRFVVTSRPEGVHLGLYLQNFVIMNLAPLTDEQQRAVIDHQLQGVNYFDHLIKFGKIREKHDALYKNLFRRHARRGSVERRSVEDFSVPDLLKLGIDEGAGYDPVMRQSSLRGDLVSEFTAPQPSSIFLRAIDDWFRARGLFEAISNAYTAGEELSLEHYFENTTERETLSLGGPCKDLKTTTMVNLKHIAFSLLYLSQKRQSPPENSWQFLVRRSNEIYEVAEKLSSVFEDAIFTILESTGVSRDGVKFGPLKDPVRTHEKAISDYATRFDDGVLPESCVMDILRARLVCNSGPEMIAVFEALKSGIEYKTTSGNVVSVSVLRVKNKFAKNDLDPTHFRNALCNLLVRFNELRVFAEVQIHHSAILAHNEKSNAHFHYKYFRQALLSEYNMRLDSELNFILERRMILFQSICSVPVLLSMLCVILGHRASGHKVHLPVTAIELYSTATRCTIQRSLPNPGDQAVLLRVLSKIASANHLDTRREFTTEHVDAVFESDAEGKALWDRLQLSTEGVPLVKIIRQPTVSHDGSRPTGGEFQFKHLSFQEALFAQTLLDSSFTSDLHHSWFRTGRIGGERLNLPFYQNAFELMGPAMVEALSIERLNLSGIELSQQGCKSLSFLLPGFLSLDLTNCSISTIQAKSLCNGFYEGTCKIQILILCENSIDDVGFLSEALEEAVCLRCLDLGKNDITKGLGSLGELVASHPCLQELKLCNSLNGIGETLLLGIEASNSMQGLSLKGCHLSDSDVPLLLPLFTNTQLTRIDLSDNLLQNKNGGKLLLSAACSTKLQVLRLQDNNFLPLKRDFINAVSSTSTYWDPYLRKSDLGKHLHTKSCIACNMKNKSVCEHLNEPRDYDYFIKNFISAKVVLR